MKTVEKIAAQGDLLIIRVIELPKSVKPIKAENGKFIVAHSETGHHHVVAERPGVEFFGGEDPMITYLKVIDGVEALLEHERSFDTHEAWLMKGGTYQVLRSREYTPEGWRPVSD